MMGLPLLQANRHFQRVTIFGVEQEVTQHLITHLFISAIMMLDQNGRLNLLLLLMASRLQSAKEETVTTQTEERISYNKRKQENYISNAHFQL